jgi:hypothetical protein
MAWTVQLGPNSQSDQLSFIGGKPRLPSEKKIPACQLCSSPQTFFFQIAMCDGAMWEDNTLGVFQSTKCADENHLIPEMLGSEPLSGADIPEGFLIQYQRNFSFVVFPTCEGTM